MALKRPSKSKGNVNDIPYNRDHPTPKTRNSRVVWRRTIMDIIDCTEEDLVRMLVEDGILPEWEGSVCPHCNKGVVGPLRSHAHRSRC